jgi:hypothetical protein
MITFVRKLNPPYKRIDFIIEGACMIVDGLVFIVSLGYGRTDFHIWWIRKKIHVFLSS